jgi:ATP-dependent DNA helicase RecQ
MPTAINLSLISRKSNQTEAVIEATLLRLKEKGIIEYTAKNNDSSITFNEVREDERTINRVSKYLEAQNELKQKKLQAVLDYVTDQAHCKNSLILNYFGERGTADCGNCSFCISKKATKSNSEKDTNVLLKLIKEKPLSSRELQQITKISEEQLIFALQELLDNDFIKVLPNNKYTIN